MPGKPITFVTRMCVCALTLCFSVVFFVQYYLLFICFFNSYFPLFCFPWLPLIASVSTHSDWYLSDAAFTSWHHLLALWCSTESDSVSPFHTVNHLVPCLSIFLLWPQTSCQAVISLCPFGVIIPWPLWRVDSSRPFSCSKVFTMLSPGAGRRIQAYPLHCVPAQKPCLKQLEGRLPWWLLAAAEGVSSL